MNRIFTYLQFFVRNIPGSIGQSIRKVIYRPFFRKLGRNVRIDIGCIFDNPANIEIGNNVWILPYSHLTAAPLNLNLKKINRPIYFRNNSLPMGIIKIGNEVSLGEFNILQGYGGIRIDDKCTTSARVSIYSMSHAVKNKENPSLKSYANSMINSDNIPCVVSSIYLEEGAWLGHGSAVFSGIIGKYSFIKSNSIINCSIPPNSISDGVNTKPRYE